MPAFKTFAVSLFASVALGAAQAAPLEIVGSAAMHKLIFEKHGEAIKAATGVEVKYSSNSSGKGLLALLEGKAGVAAVADHLPDALEGVKKMSPGVKVPTTLKVHEVFTDQIVAIVHRDNAAAPSPAQIKGLFSGTAANWKDAGGPDLPVKVVVGPAGAATTEAFLKPVLAGAPLSAQATELRTASAMLSEVARDKAAIGSASLDVAEKTPGVRIVPGLKVSRPMAFVTLGEASPELARLTAFLKSPAGQKLMSD